MIESTRRTSAFRYRSRETFIPIGINLGWWTHSARKTYDYEVWMGKIGGGNEFPRGSLAPWVCSPLGE